MSLATLRQKTAAMIDKINVLSAPPHCDTSLIEDWSYFCYSNSRLDMIDSIDTRSGTNFSRMFSNCTNLEAMPALNTENGTNFSYMFMSCSALKAVAGINTANGTMLTNMFNGCTALTEVESIDLSGCTLLTAATNLFLNCRSLLTIKKMTFSPTTVVSANMFSGCSKLENITFDGKLKITNGNLKLNASPNLTAQSLASLISVLQDNTQNPTYTITLGAENLAKLTDEQKLEITSKNFNLA